MINDLLDRASTNLKIREDNNSLIGSYVQGVKTFKLIDFEYFLELLNKGERNRQYGKTDENEKYIDVYSSRSHTIDRIVWTFKLYILDDSK